MPAPKDPERYKAWCKKIGDIHRGKIESDETRKKKSKSHIGRKNPHVGTPCTKETREKIGNANRGRPSPFKGISRSETICKKISESTKGRKSPMLGKQFTQEHREKIRQAHVGKKHTLETIKKLKIARNSRPPATKPTRQKMSNSRTGEKHIFYGKHRSKETCIKISKTLTGLYCGEKSPSWLGGISFGKYCPKFNQSFKNGVRDYYHHKCMMCGHVWQQGEKKHAVHHVYYNKKACCDETDDGRYTHTLPDGEIIEVIGDPNKFVILCSGKCHTKTNHNRLYWALYFEELINKKFGGQSYPKKQNIPLNNIPAVA